ncbi:uncharacterized protein LOC143236003 [Tachypleus tridentatus]|uniref:uncharacterized protein LOC143236003 n=1 Tax=Tachypleus tridentatus TaxID=6853 RepID=UPI003FD54564
MLTSNVTLLKQVLLNHVLKGTYYSVALNDGLTLISIGGAPLTFQDRRGLMLVNSIPIVEPDFAVLNGVIHVINRVLLPSEVLKDCQCLPDQVQSPPSGEGVSQRHPQSPPIKEIPHPGSTLGVPPSDQIQTSILQEDDSVPSPPKLETTEGSLPPARNEILEIIRMPGLNVKGQPISLNTYYDLLQTSGLVELLSQKGPFTVLVPTDDVFDNLPDGVLEELRNNPELLRRVLLTHILGLSLNPQTLQNNMIIETNNGFRLFINILNSGKVILIGGSKLIASTVAQNGYVYAINRIIYPLPGLDIFSEIKERPNLSQLLSLVIKSGLQETLRGDEPYTIFAPTDEAFAAVPEGVLQGLLSNSDALRELLMNHVVEGAHYKKEFSSGFILPTSRGQKLQFVLITDGDYRVNDANIQESDISTGNGVIHVIDRVLFAPPASQPSPGTSDVSQVQQKPQGPEKPLSGQSIIPTTTGPSSEHQRPQPGHEVPSGEPQKPPSEEVFVRTDGGQLPSPPRLEVEGGPPPTNTILQIIKMPGLNIQGQLVGLTIFYDLLQVSGLLDLLSGQGPFTVFIPSDDAFASLPAGVLDELRNNPELLRRVLLNHVVSRSIKPQGLQNNMLVETNDNRRLFINVLNDGKLILIGGAKLIASTKAQNGEFYVINRLIYPIPRIDIFTELKERSTLSQLVSLVMKSGLQETFFGKGPYTLFAPTNEAFAAIPENVLQELLSNQDALREFIMNHVVEGVHYKEEFTSGFGLLALRGQQLKFLVTSDGDYRVNDANIQESDISTGNGVIHMIDRVLFAPPTSHPSPGTQDVSQVQQPQGPEKPLSSQSIIPTTTGSSSEHQRPQPGHEVPPSGEPQKPPSQEVFVDIDGGEVSSPPRLEVEGGLPPTNTILQVIKMPGLNVQGQPVGLTVFYDLLQTSGLLDMLNKQGPFTVFIPSDDAFASLPAGVLDELRNNPELLRRVLLNHVVNRSIKPQTLQNNMVVETNDNRRLFVNVLNDGKLKLIGGSNLVASTLAKNGDVYVINGVIYPLPGLDIFTELQEHPNLNQLVSLVLKSGLKETLQRNGPYTVFAPTDAAFEALSKSVLQDLLSKPDVLQELIMNHVVEGVHYKKEFTSGFTLPTSRDKQLQFNLKSGGVYGVNDANIQESDISTGNGVIHVIDRVLFAPPASQPSPGTSDVSQVQQKPQGPEKPLSGQSIIPTTTGPSSEHQRPQPGHDVPSSGEPQKPPSEEVFVRTDGAQVPSPPRLEVEGVLPPTNTILQVIKMPGLNIQGQPVGLTIFYDLLQVSGLLDMLSEKGPFTLFIPSDNAFTNLPGGRLEELRNNPELLRRVLLCHVVNRSFKPETLQNNMVLDTNNGRQIFVNVLNGGKLILIGGSKLIASTSAQNGDVYVISDLIYPVPGLDIFTELKEHPNLSQLMSLVLTSGLKDTLLEGGPHTIFAPTDTAFARLPESVLQGLMSNPDALQELILNHVVEGVHYKKEFTSGSVLPTSRGQQLQFTLAQDGVYKVNDANIQEFDVSTGNGVIHVIDRVLFMPPVPQPGTGTPDDSQEQQPPQRPEKPSSGQSDLPTTTSSSFEQQRSKPGHKVPPSGEPQKPPSQEVFVRTDDGQLPSPPRLEVEDGLSQRNIIPEIIKMPGLNIQGKLVGLTIFYDFLQTSGLLELLNEEGPFTVLVPTDDAFDNLPDGVLEELRNNPELLRRVLLTHILGLSLNPQTLQDNMIIENNNGLQLFIKLLNDRKKILIGGAKLIASTVAQNGYVYVINSVIYPVPDVDIFTVINSRPSFSQLLNLIETSGLEETLRGNGSFTFFAPTNEAFAAFPKDILQNLLSDSKALREVLLNHLVDGVHYRKEFVNDYELQTSRGKPLRFLVASDGSVKVNDASVVEYDITAGNGVIHLIDHVLFTPQSPPELGVRRPAVNQGEHPSTPPKSVTPDTDRSTHPSTTGQSQHPGPHDGPVPSLPELKANGVTIPSTKTTIVQIIEMPNLDVQDQPVSLSNFSDLIQVSGLTNLINQQKPFTVLVPTDDAFSRLPEGLVKDLKNNTELLRRILLFHIINFSINPQSLQNNMVIETNNGRRIFINVLDGGKNVLIEGSKVLASTPALNGYIYIITGFNYPLPSVDIFTELRSQPNLERLATSIVRAGLEEIFTGESPYTIFAPTDEAFAALPANDLQQLLANPDALKEVILNHVVEGVHYQKELTNDLTLPTPRGQNLRFLVASDGTVSVNDAKVIKADISTGNGVIHLIDRLLVTSPDVDVFGSRSSDSASGPQVKSDIAELARGMGVDTFFSWLTETGLDNVIQDGGEYTVFAPTDEAVASLPETIQTSVRDNPDRLRPIVKYHISRSRILPNQTQNEETITTLAQDKNIRFNYYHNGSLITAGGATIGDIRRSGNIMVIVINRVLYGPQGNIYTIVSSSPILKDLSRFIELVGLQDILKGPEPYTLFAPSKEAIANLPQGEYQKLLNDKDKLKSLLFRHLVKGTIFTSGLTHGMILKTDSDEELTVKFKPECIAIDGIDIVYSDVTATNGVVHVIDHFL